jgi:hypothetical protein
VKYRQYGGERALKPTVDVANQCGCDPASVNDDVRNVCKAIAWRGRDGLGNEAISE